MNMNAAGIATTAKIAANTTIVAVANIENTIEPTIDANM